MTGAYAQIDREERDEADDREELLGRHVRAGDEALPHEEHDEKPARRLGPEEGLAAVDLARDPSLGVAVQQRAADEHVGGAEVVDDEEEAHRVPAWSNAAELSAWEASGLWRVPGASEGSSRLEGPPQASRHEG